MGVSTQGNVNFFSVERPAFVNKTQMNTEDIMLSERSQTQKDMCMVYHSICQTTQSYTEAESNGMTSKSWEGGDGLLFKSQQS